MIRIGCAAILLLTAAAVGLAFWFPDRVLPACMTWLDVGESPHEAEYIYVLGGSLHSRPFAAAALFRAGYAPEVLVSHVRSGKDQTDDDIPPEHQIMRSVLIRRGVPESAIAILGNDHDSTLDEAQSLAKFLEQSDSDARVLVVTSDYHSRRTRWIFQTILAGRAHQATVISSPAYRFCPDDWWRTADGFNSIAGEYLKLPAYYVRYGPIGTTGWIAIAAGAVLIVVWRRRRKARAVSAGERR